MSPKMRAIGLRALRWAGFLFLALFAFLIALQLTFPYDRVKDRVIDALSAKYEVTIGSVERGLMPGRVTFKRVLLKTKTAKPDDPAPAYFLDSVEIDLGLLPLLRGTIAVNLDAQIAKGRLTGRIDLTMAGVPKHIHLEGDGVPAENLPLRGYVPVPLAGKIDLDVDLDIPSSKGKVDWPKLEGEIKLACKSGCDIGDGVTKVKLQARNKRSEQFQGEGITLAKLHLNQMDGKLEIAKGLAKITKMDVKSDDVKFEMDFQMKLDSTFEDSMVTGCLRFAGDPSLNSREEIYKNTYSALQTTGGPLGPDKLYHIKLDGPYKNIKRLPQVCGKDDHGPGGDENFEGDNHAKPNLTVQPDEPPTQPTITPVPDPIVIDAGVPGPADAAAETTAPAAGSGAAGVPPPPGPEPLPPPPGTFTNGGEPAHTEQPPPVGAPDVEKQPEQPPSETH